MSATTSPDAIVYPVSTDFIAPLETTLAAMATSIQTALTAQGKYFVSSVGSVAARSAVFPSAVQGNRVYRSDLGYEETYFAAYNVSTNPGGATPAGWYPTVGELAAGFRVSTASIVLSTVYAPITGLLAVGNTNGTPVRLAATITTANGTSGLDRQGDYLIKCDGVAVPNATVRFSVPVISGTSSTYTVVVSGTHTPTVGAHTWTVEGKGDDASSIIVFGGSLIVTPYMTR